MFHVAGWLPVEDLQPCATDMGSGLCGLLNACRRVTITYRHTDATDSPMFSLAPILPMSDIRCVNRPISKSSADFLIQYERKICLLFQTQRMVVGYAPFYVKFWVKLTHSASKMAIFNRYLLVPPQPFHLSKNVQL